VRRGIHQEIMGNAFRKIFDSVFGNKEMRVCFELMLCKAKLMPEKAPD
jgi:hypothetical protein